MSTLPPRVHEAGRCRMVSYDLGAHLAQWLVDDEPVVWLGRHAVLDGTRPIRGGVPVCFPWFATGPTGDLRPSHGVVRTATWRPAQTRDEEVWAWDLRSADLAGEPGSEHLPGPFELRHAVTLAAAETGAPALRVAFTVVNPSPDPLPVEVALHTYLAVADVRHTRVLGLDGAEYHDKVLGRRDRQTGAVTLDAETDRVYDSPGTAPLTHGGTGIVVDDGHRRLLLRSEGAGQTVVWNPWSEKAAGMDDLADGDWTRFVCVETAATGDHALQVPAGGTRTVAFTLTAHLTTDADPTTR